MFYNAMGGGGFYRNDFKNNLEISQRICQIFNEFKTSGAVSNSWGGSAWF